MAGSKATASPRRGLTVPFIEALQPRADRYEVADRRAPGLRLRVHPSGVKSFRWSVTALGRVITIGPFHPAENAPPGFMSLKSAREWLERLKVAHAGGTLPAVEAALRRELNLEPSTVEQTRPDRRTFAQIAEEFYADDIKKNRKRPEDARAILDNDLLPVLGARPFDEITTLECRDVVKRTIARGAKTHAGKVLQTLKQLWNYSQANGFTERNPPAPLEGRKIGVEQNESSRVLSAEEIPVFWKALDAARASDRRQTRDGHVLHDTQKLRPATAAALRVLLLTAVRSGELLRARWEHVDLDGATWKIPLENQKLTKEQERKRRKKAQEDGSDGAFVIPLTPLALEQFKVLHAEAKGSAWVVASPDPESKTGRYDDKALGHAMRRLFASELLVLPGGEVTPHDLRRSARTHLAKLGVSHWICERCLNHSLGKIGETYDRHDYLPERTEALAKWDAYIQRLVAPEQSNVAFLASSKSGR